MANPMRTLQQIFLTKSLTISPLENTYLQIKDKSYMYTQYII